jgi:multidrug resistance efflux pump
MGTRDEYLEKLKSQLDVWNGEVSKWEAKVKSAQAEIKPQYEQQLELMKQHRESAMYQMKLLQDAAGDAWMELARGADEAWATFREAVEKASGHFRK